MSTRIRSISTGLCVAAAACALSACARPWMHDESGRIDDGMRLELFSEATPGAEGIALGAEAPPLAEPFAEPKPGRLARPRHAGGRFTPLQSNTPSRGNTYAQRSSSSPKHD